MEGFKKDSSCGEATYSGAIDAQVRRHAMGVKQQDHYTLLGLNHLRFLATEDQMRKSYREIALKPHPNRQAALILAEESEAAKQAKNERNRGTPIFLPTATYPMFPEKLAMEGMSLKQEELCNAVTVSVVLHSDGRIAECSVDSSIVKLTYVLTYESDLNFFI